MTGYPCRGFSFLSLVPPDKLRQGSPMLNYTTDSFHFFLSSSLIIVVFFLFLWGIKSFGPFIFRMNLKLWTLQILVLGRTPWTKNQPAARQLTVHGNMNTEKTHSTMPGGGGGIRTHNLTIWAGENIDRTATVIGVLLFRLFRTYFGLKCNLFSSPPFS
jgi:hypothetical protein